jgi:hypothetical protein
MNMRATVLNKSERAAFTQKHMIVITSGERNSVRQGRQKTGPQRGPVKLVRPNLPVAVMPMVVPMPMMPVNFGRRSLRIFPDRSGAGRIGQRQRLGLLSRSGKDQYRTNCSEAQNSRHLH